MFGPLDAPWHQRAVESLVKNAKRAIHFAVGDRRMSASEFLTVYTEEANVKNEIPLGTLPSPNSGINWLTPNSLLIGWSLPTQAESMTVNRFHLDRIALILIQCLRTCGIKIIRAVQRGPGN